MQRLDNAEFPQDNYYHRVGDSSIKQIEDADSPKKIPGLLESYPILGFLILLQVVCLSNFMAQYHLFDFNGLEISGERATAVKDNSKT
mmetsp:Transcript_42087/g.64531  ORF Transcript_42087/g.64531 Transcript_42087/m.64531 type:complete len:88 (+) Transcript_42087:1226-1489(+)